MAMKEEPFEVANATGLTDADWADINRLKQIHKQGGSKALSKAMDELYKDPMRAVCVMGAFYPSEVREAIKDQMAEIGMTEEYLRELVRKLESPARDQ
jgi:hypothetical protein